MESREHCKEKKVSSVTNVFGNICFCRALKMAPNVLDSQSEILLENFGEKAAWRIEVLPNFLTISYYPRNG